MTFLDAARAQAKMLDDGSCRPSAFEDEAVRYRKRREEESGAILVDMINALRDDLRQAQAREDKYRAALEEYDDETNWGAIHGLPPDQWLLDGNGYDLARTTLKETTP